MLTALTPDEREVVRRAMETVLDHVHASEFVTRLGLTPERRRELLAVWPKVNDESDRSDACAAINNSLNELLHGVPFTEDQAQTSIGVSKAEMDRIYVKWAKARGWKRTGLAGGP